MVWHGVNGAFVDRVIFSPASSASSETPVQPAAAQPAAAQPVAAQPSGRPSGRPSPAAGPVVSQAGMPRGTRRPKTNFSNGLVGSVVVPSWAEPASLLTAGMAKYCMVMVVSPGRSPGSTSKIA
jgi:hypothetical protein